MLPNIMFLMCYAVSYDSLEKHIFSVSIFFIYSFINVQYLDSFKDIDLVIMNLIYWKPIVVKLRNACRIHWCTYDPVSKNGS
jgi:hypothetical protein